MRRVAWLLLGLAAAGPARAPLPLPPIPPAHPPPSTIAPMPDLNALRPTTQDGAGVSVGFTNFRSPNDNTSLGYPTGSRFQSKEDARPITTPGFTVRVPLQ
jgi:hypothetical protein